MENTRFLFNTGSEGPELEGEAAEEESNAAYTSAGGANTGRGANQAHMHFFLFFCTEVPIQTPPKGRRVVFEND
jgi:hypothetical protein